jgi:hypothetical protein
MGAKGTAKAAQADALEEILGQNGISTADPNIAKIIHEGQLYAPGVRSWADDSYHCTVLAGTIESFIARVQALNDPDLGITGSAIAPDAEATTGRRSYGLG